MARVLNCTVFYDNYDEIISYIDTVRNISAGTVDIVVVVNKDMEGRAESLLAMYQESDAEKGKVYVRDYGINVGYMNALLRPIEEPCFQEYDYYILSNTDIFFPDEDIFTKLINNKYDDSIGCIAPSIYSLAYHYYCNPHYRERIPRSQYQRLKLIFSSAFFASIYVKLGGIKAKRSKEEEESNPCKVYAPHGSYIIFTSHFIDDIQGNIYPVTLYSEEAYIGEMLHRFGMTCYYDPTLKIEHMDSQTVGGIIQKQRFSMWKESVEYILKEFY